MAAMGGRLLGAALAAVMLAGCDATIGFRSELVELRTLHVEVIAANRTEEDRALLYTGSTLVAPGDVIPACDVVRLAYRPEPDRRGPDSWSFVIGRPAYDGDGAAIGVVGPFSRVARSSDAPLAERAGRIGVLVDADGIRWRVLGDDEAYAPRPGC